jgi:hypothetical protein
MNAGRPQACLATATDASIAKPSAGVIVFVHGPEDLA